LNRKSDRFINDNDKAGKLNKRNVANTPWEFGRRIMISGWRRKQGDLEVKMFRGQESVGQRLKAWDWE
jgi:hypothetical protein